MNAGEPNDLKERLERAVVPPPDPFAGWDVIDRYTRAQALEDGVLVDVTETAREAGIKYPVALTAEVFGKYVEIPEGVTGQDVRGRLWDILWMFRSHANGTLRPVRQWREGPASVILYALRVQMKPYLAKPTPVTLKAHCGSGDSLEPVITIMLPDQD